jgi:hypothetical protein
MVKPMTTTTRKSTATDPELIAIGSHSVTPGHPSGHDATREELYFTFEVTWRGVRGEYRMEANRYTFSDGDWSEWRIFGYMADAYTDTARQALREACAPIVADWLKSDDPNGYAGSRARAFCAMIREQLRDSVGRGAYALDGVQTTLDRNIGELTYGDITRLKNAMVAARTFWAHLDN